jgi:hypothetical protein
MYTRARKYQILPNAATVERVPTTRLELLLDGETLACQSRWVKSWAFGFAELGILRAPTAGTSGTSPRRLKPLTLWIPMENRCRAIDNFVEDAGRTCGFVACSDYGA